MLHEQLTFMLVSKEHLELLPQPPFEKRQRLVRLYVLPLSVELKLGKQMQAATPGDGLVQLA